MFVSHRVHAASRRLPRSAILHVCHRVLVQSPSRSILCSAVLQNVESVQSSHRGMGRVIDGGVSLKSTRILAACNYNRLVRAGFDLLGAQSGRMVSKVTLSLRLLNMTSFHALYRYVRTRPEMTFQHSPRNTVSSVSKLPRHFEDVYPHIISRETLVYAWCASGTSSKEITFIFSDIISSTLLSE